MKALQRRTYSFDTRSVMLFAALSLGGMGALHAQTAASSSPPQLGPQSKGTTQSGAGFTVGPSGNATTAAAAFERADTNKDGQLSAQEAATLPAISQRFKELDTDKNGALSRAEFDKGVQS
ncbi:EF-hand domain-containing protein [Acidovorax sp. Q11]